MDRQAILVVAAGVLSSNLRRALLFNQLLLGLSCNVFSLHSIFPAASFLIFHHKFVGAISKIT